MDDHTSKHAAKGLRTDAQRTTTNIYVSRVEKLIFSDTFLLPLSATEE